MFVSPWTGDRSRVMSWRTNDDPTGYKLAMEFAVTRSDSSNSLNDRRADRTNPVATASSCDEDGVSLTLAGNCSFAFFRYWWRIGDDSICHCWLLSSQECDGHPWLLVLSVFVVGMKFRDQWNDDHLINLKKYSRLQRSQVPVSLSGKKRVLFFFWYITFIRQLLYATVLFVATTQRLCSCCQ